MGNQTHSLMWVTVKRQLNETDHLLSSGVDQVVIKIIQFAQSASSRDFQKLQGFNVSTVSGSQASSSGVRSFRVPKLELIIVIDSQKKVFLDVLLHFRIPDTGSRVGLVLDVEAVLDR